MSSSFFGFNIGVRALTSSQRALEVVSHNIANINTEGYRKQDAILTTTQPEGIPAINRLIATGQLGSGVQVSEIQRFYDHYIERELNYELHNIGKWETSQTVFVQIESIFSEPSENGIRNMMDAYWNAWSTLQSTPEDYTARKNLVETSKGFCSLLKNTYQKLENLRQDLNTEIGIKVTDINSLANQIKDLNSSIKEVSISGDNPNDLMDKRDLLINKLSKIVNTEVRETSFDQVDIFIGGTAIVRENTCFPLEAELNPATGFYDVKWEDSGRMADIKNGEIYSMINFRDNYIPDMIDRLDNLANFFINETNAIHQNGYGLDGTSTGYAFFTGSGITDISISADIDADNSLIAAAKNSGQPGDNSNIIDILNLRSQKLLESGTNSTDEYYNNMITKMGVESQQCIREAENSQLLVNQISSRKETVSGVSLDEELVNMVKFQHAYNAAAKIINVMDELMDTLINQTS